MNENIGSIEKLEAACAEFVYEFSPDALGDDNKRSATVRDLQLSLGMRAMGITYRSEEEQKASFMNAENSMLSLSGNPTAYIETFTEHNFRAIYSYDRDTGLVVVNNYTFPKDEVRALRRSDYDALSMSIATKGVTSFLMTRALTPVGIYRLTEDVKKAIVEA